MRNSRQVRVSWSIALLLLLTMLSPAAAQNSEGGKSVAAAAPSPSQGWPVPPGHYSLLASYADAFLSHSPFNPSTGLPSAYGVTWYALTVKHSPNLADFFILDVRPTRVFPYKHLVAAKNIPYDQVAQRLTELPLDRSILVVCDQGLWSGQVAAILGIMGYSVRILQGGLQNIDCDGPEVSCTPY
jgi:rhodanese-related sulfurtransferase